MVFSDEHTQLPIVVEVVMNFSIVTLFVYF